MTEEQREKIAKYVRRIEIIDADIQVYEKQKAEVIRELDEFKKTIDK